MKKSIIISALLACLLFSACNNYLDIVPKGSSELNTTGDYLGLLETVDPTYPMVQYWYLADECSSYQKSDLESYKYPLNSIGFFWNENMDRYKYTVEDDLYNKCYNRIAKYNVVVTNIGGADGPEADKILGVAQAKILRAYNYFVLVNTFARPYDPATATTDNGIIIHTELDLNAVSKQYKLSDVYAFIEQDIREALPGLPEQALNEFRPSRAFGHALKAKVHLFKGELDPAIEAGLETMKSGYHKLWNMNEMYNEVLSSPQGSLIQMMPSLWGMLASHPRNHPENLLYAFLLNDMEPSPNYIRKPVVDLYEKDADLRYITCLGYYVPDRPTAEAGAVQFMSPQVKWNCGGMRLSEVYLMVAESYARKGDKEHALLYLNDLRKNRMLASKYEDLEAADAAEALKLVREERKRELVLTTNGFFDMRRYCTQFNETLTKEYTNAAGEAQIYTLRPDSPLLVAPFPQNAMETSDLVQNTK